MHLRLLTVDQLVMIFQNTKMGRTVPISHNFLYLGHVVSSSEKNLIFERFGSMQQSLSPNICEFWGTLDIYMTIKWKLCLLKEWGYRDLSNEVSFTNKSFQNLTRPLKSSISGRSVELKITFSNLAVVEIYRLQLVLASYQTPYGRYISRTGGLPHSV